MAGGNPPLLWLELISLFEIMRPKRAGAQLQSWRVWSGMIVAAASGVECVGCVSMSHPSNWVTGKLRSAVSPCMWWSQSIPGRAFFFCPPNMRARFCLNKTVSMQWLLGRDETCKKVNWKILSTKSQDLTHFVFVTSFRKRVFNQCARQRHWVIALI